MKKQIVLLIMSVVIVNCGCLQAETPNLPDADINKDGKINMVDFGWLAKYWLFTLPDPNEFAYIPGGTFEMGDHSPVPDPALLVHTVILDSFYMSKYEITNQQYCDYLNYSYPAQIKIYNGIVYAADDYSKSFPYCNTSINTISFSGGVFSVNIKDGITDMSDHPVGMVSWYGAIAYCNWKSQQEGLESCYNLSTRECDFGKDGFRLPTEAEWEYAARGGEHDPYYRYPWGDSIDGSMANYWESGDPYETRSYPWTTPVGYYDGEQIPSGTNMANGYGLYDMAGNVSEWCNDWYDPNYYSTSPTDNPTGPASGTSRVYRSNPWTNPPGYCHVAARHEFSPDSIFNIFGFRVCVFASFLD